MANVYRTAHTSHFRKVTDGASAVVKIVTIVETLLPSGARILFNERFVKDCK